MTNLVYSSRVINATPQQIFDLLADPAMHVVIDGSGTVRAPRPNNPARLSKGAKFYMSMRMLLPYRVYNVVTEFDEPRQIAWGHGRHYWRYELEAADGGTLVTETWDYRKWGKAGRLLEAAGFAKRNRLGIESTLARLAQHFDNS